MNYTGARMQSPVPDLSVVIPAHNESGNILSLLDEVEAALGGRVPYEVLVVDDGSSDGMDRLLAEAAAKRPALRPLRHRRQSGQSAAIATGGRAARAPWIATLDGDGQNDPADIPALWQRLQTGAGEGGAGEGLGMIAGHRANRRDTWVRRASSRIANRVRARLLSDATPDTGCGLKLFSRQLFLDMPHFDHMHRYLPALALRQGAKVVSVVVNHRPRGQGRSHYGINNRLWVGIVDLCGVMWLNRRIRLPGGADPLGGEK